MPVIVTEDLINGAAFTYSQQGGTLKRVFYVAGLPVSSATLVNAATAPGIPQYGQSHPLVAGLYASQIDVKPVMKDSKTQALVTVTYVSPQIMLSGGTQIRGSTTSAPKIFNKDSNGNPVLVKYTPPGGQQVSDLVKLTVPANHCVLEFIRIESASVLAKSQKYGSQCNSSMWQGGAAGTWKCRNVDWESLGSVQLLGGLNSNKVTYVFEYDEDGWEQIYPFQDPVTHQFPTDAKPSKNNDQGIYTYTPSQVDFNALNLPSA